MQAFEIVEANLRHTMQQFAGLKEPGELRQLPGVTISCSGVDSAVFNAAFLREPVSEPRELDRRIAIARIHFSARGLRWSFWVCDHHLDSSSRARANAAFSRHGLRTAAETPGMIAGRVLPPARPLPTLDCHRVRDAETRLAFCHITSVCFGLPFETSREVYGSERIWQRDLIGYIGYLDGEPVGTSATVSAAGAIGIYSVATLPDYQRCGIGEKLVRVALDRARLATGMERSVLQSTPAGLALYRKMGYREVTRFTVYVSS